MTQPHITQFSTDEEFAAYAGYVANTADTLNSGMSEKELFEMIGVVKSIAGNLSECMLGAFLWRKSQRTELRELSEQRRSERRDARNEQ